MTNTANDGTVETLENWGFESVDVPAMATSGGRVKITGEFSKENGALGLDGIAISTEQKCLPR